MGLPDGSRDVVIAQLLAEIDALLDTVGELAAIVRGTGGYTTPEQQASMRGARRLLGKHGRAA